MTAPTVARLAADVRAGRLDLDIACATWRALNPPPPGWPYPESEGDAGRGPYNARRRRDTHPTRVCTACGEPVTAKPNGKGWRRTCGAPECVAARRIVAGRMGRPGPRPRGPARP